LGETRAQLFSFPAPGSDRYIDSFGSGSSALATPKPEFLRTHPRDGSKNSGHDVRLFLFATGSVESANGGVGLSRRNVMIGTAM
jgi:hypothetical protein